MTDPPAEAPEKENDTLDRSILIGIVVTLLFHVLLVWVAPHLSFSRFSGVHSGINVNRINRNKTFDFQLDPGKPPPEKKLDPFKYVETNSAAPENIPDKTTNFSNRNQQSAQEVAAKELDPEHRPTVKGQDKIKDDSTIVSGQMAPPQLAPAPTPEVTKEDKQAHSEEKARQEKVPLAGFDKTEGKDPDGIATNVARNSKSTTTNAEQLVEGAHDATDPNGGLVAVTQATKQQPKARPRLSSTSLNRNSILTTRLSGVANVGIVGIDARWSEYGEYMHELIEIVQAQWYNILDVSHVSPPHGSHVVVTFRLTSKGEASIIKIEDADAGKQGVISCESAITDPQPYRKWPDQMIAVLGDSQDMTFSFYYQ